MRSTTRSSRALVASLLCAAVAAASTGCAGPRGGLERAAADTDLSVLTGEQNPTLDPGFAVPTPGRLRGPVVTPDLVVVGRGTLSPKVRGRVSGASGVSAAVPLSIATAPVRGRMVTLGAIDAVTFRRFVPAVAARTDAVWQRLAEGDLAITPEVADELDHPLGGDLVLGNQAGALTLRVGAEASLPHQFDGVVNHLRGSQLGMVRDNALLVAVDGADPASVAERLRGRLGRRATVSVLGAAPASGGRRTAFLTGGSVADAVGSFSYRHLADGSVRPDPAWVAANVRTEVVPILGRVTCHRVMLPQLRGALQEVVDRGLRERIDTSDFGGCYAPRFIAHDPARGLSLHTWGIAVDLNVQGNLRGTTGKIDRRVVDIFKRWGFAWGGDWAYTDPMHFELAALVRSTT